MVDSRIQQLISVLCYGMLLGSSVAPSRWWYSGIHYICNNKESHRTAIFRNPENLQFLGIQLINSKLDVQLNWNLRDSRLISL